MLIKKEKADDALNIKYVLNEAFDFVLPSF